MEPVKIREKASFLIIILILSLSIPAAAQGGIPKVVAHRTAWKAQALPQNSIEGLRGAMDLKCYAAEIDVHLTKDNNLIVTHDRNIGGLPIETSSFKDLEAALESDEKLLKLEDFISYAGGSNLNLWLDLKTSKTDMKKAVDLGYHVAREVERLGATDRIVFIGPHFEALVKVLEVLPEAAVLYTGTDKAPDSLDQLGFKGVFVSQKKIISGEFDIPLAKKAGLKVGAYTVNKETAMKALVKKQVDFIVTDEPEILLGLLKGMGDPSSLKEP